jgi:hypothetical protein
MLLFFFDAPVHIPTVGLAVSNFVIQCYVHLAMHTNPQLQSRVEQYLRDCFVGFFVGEDRDRDALLTGISEGTGLIDDLSGIVIGYTQQPARDERSEFIASLVHIPVSLLVSFLVNIPEAVAGAYIGQTALKVVSTASVIYGGIVNNILNGRYELYV